MEIAVQDKCDDLLEIYQAMAKVERLALPNLILAGAGIYLASGKPLDVERLQQCKRILKEREGIFSDFRGNAEFIICCKMALSDSPEQYLQHLQLVYNALKPGKVLGSELAVIAALTLVDRVEPDRYEEVIARTKQVYQEMKKAHRWLTGEDDLPFAALMAITGSDARAMHEEAEQIYEILRDTLRADKDTLQTLSHVLSLYVGTAQEKCDKITSIARRLSDTRHPMSPDKQMAVLGTLAASPLTADELTVQIIETDDYLRRFKPFKGVLGISVNTRRMYAAQIVQSVFADSNDVSLAAMMNASVQVTVVTMLILYSILFTSLQG